MGLVFEGVLTHRPHLDHLVVYKVSFQFWEEVKAFSYGDDFFHLSGLAVPVGLCKLFKIIIFDLLGHL